MSPEIKACPFCKALHARVFRRRDEHGLHSFGVQCSGSDCSVCGPERGTAEEAIAAWNRRAQPAEEVQPAGEVAKSLAGGVPSTLVWFVDPEKLPVGTALYTSPPAADAETVRKAARYDYLRMRVCGIGSKGFDFVNLPPMPPNWARGSIAQHFDDAIDAALAASKEKKE